MQIESIESLVHINLVKGDLIARCECDHDKLKSAHDTLRPTLEARSHQQEVVTAAWARQGKGGKGSVTGAINNAMTMMGMKITRTPVDQRWHAMQASDRARAQAVTQLRTAQTYTDGATIPGRATGWGYCTTGTNGEGEQEESRSWGRLEGEQSNDLGEAMALLQALRNTHPLTPVDVYIDNGGVVATTNKRHHRDVRARMRQGGRAIWNRIEQLIQKEQRHTHRDPLDTQPCGRGG